jgi:aspartate carbamoyltransferase catalytic subunit
MKNFPSVLESIKDLDREQIDGLLRLAKKFKSRPTDPSLLIQRKPIVATSFLENSTRTKHSFTVATHRLGAVHLDFQAESSSLKKGESLEETLLTLSAQGVDVCVIRTSVSKEMEKFKSNPPIRIINGGDGTHQHPTQALLDLFSMLELGLDLKDKTICIIGDCKHSRVANSLIDLLPMFGAKIILCGPKEFLPNNLSNENVTLCENRDEALSKTDIIYALRIQNERHDDSIKDVMDNYHSLYGIDTELLKSLNKEIPVLHPGPCNIGVELSKDVLRSRYYQGYKQVEDSIYMRMAIIAAVLENNDKTVGIIDGYRLS